MASDKSPDEGLRLPVQEDGLRLSDQEKASQRRRSIAIGIGVAALCALFYLITVFKMGPAVMNRPL